MQRTDFEATRIGSPAGLVEQPARVARHRVEVDEGEGWGGRREDRVVAGLQQLALDGLVCSGHGAGERIWRPRDRYRRTPIGYLESAAPGEVAEWLKALAC